MIASSVTDTQCPVFSLEKEPRKLLWTFFGGAFYCNKLGVALQASMFFYEANGYISYHSFLSSIVDKFDHPGLPPALILNLVNRKFCLSSPSSLM